MNRRQFFKTTLGVAAVTMAAPILPADPTPDELFVKALAELAANAQANMQTLMDYYR